jgi:hypothetical protein
MGNDELSRDLTSKFRIAERCSGRSSVKNSIRRGDGGTSVRRREPVREMDWWPGNIFPRRISKMAVVGEVAAVGINNVDRREDVWTRKEARIWKMRSDAKRIRDA